MLTRRGRQLARLGKSDVEIGEEELLDIFLSNASALAAAYNVDLGDNVVRTLVTDDIGDDYIAFHTKLKGDERDAMTKWYKLHFEIEELPDPETEDRC